MKHPCFSTKSIKLAYKQKLRTCSKRAMQNASFAFTRVHALCHVVFICTLTTLIRFKLPPKMYGSLESTTQTQ